MLLAAAIIAAPLVALWIYDKCSLLKMKALEVESKTRELEGCKAYVYTLERKLNQVENRIYPELCRIVSVVANQPWNANTVSFRIDIAHELLMSADKQLLAQYAGAEVARQISCAVPIPMGGNYR